MDQPAVAVHTTPSLRRLGASALLYTSLIFSSSLQFTLGPEAVFRTGGFYTDAPTTRDARFRTAHPDFGLLSSDASARTALETGADWKFSSFWADAGYYASQSSDLDQSIAPYKYRFVPTMAVRGLVAATGFSLEHAFVVWNAVVCLVTALLFEQFLLAFFGFHPITALLGGCLFVTSAGITGTLGFPMLEPASALFSVLIVWSVAYGHTSTFLFASILGVFTKEVLAIGSLLWLLAAPPTALLKRALVACAPVLAFVAGRLVLGGSALEVNYGYDLLRGEFPAYGRRVFALRSLAGAALQVFLSFSFLWLGLRGALDHPFLRRCLPVVPVTIIAAVLLSSRLTRVLGVLFPIIVPGFLAWIERMLAPERAFGPTRWRR